MCLTSCTSAVIIGHFSADGNIKPEHFHYSMEDQRHNFIIINNKQEIAEYLINHFSTTTVLDLGFCTGNVSTYVHIVTTFNDNYYRGYLNSSY